MNTSDIIGVFNVVAQFAVAVVAVWAVLASLRANKRQIESGDRQLKEQIKESEIQINRQIESSDKQLQEQIKESEIQIQKQIEENRRLATEERQQQSCPIIVPTKAIPHVPAVQVPGTQQQYLYTSEVPPLKGNISWGLQFLSVPIEVSNIGTGPAFNVHCVLYGYDNAYSNQFISWNNGPIGPGKDETIRSRHPDQGELWLDRNDSVDGEHTLHYPPAGPNPNQAQACLTISLSVFLIIRPTISGYACL